MTWVLLLFIGGFAQTDIGGYFVNQDQCQAAMPKPGTPDAYGHIVLWATCVLDQPGRPTSSHP